MISDFNEDGAEKSIIEIFQILGYEYIFGPEFERNYEAVILEDEFRSAVASLNPKSSSSAVDEAVRKVLNLDNPDLIENNLQFHEMVTDGVSVSYYDTAEGMQKSDLIRLIDYDVIQNNSFKVINQFSVSYGNVTKRPDIVIFVNGLPLVVFELKSLTREDADVSQAYRQIKNYQQDIPSLFYYNAFSVITDIVNARAGTITSNEGRYMAWKSEDGKETSFQAETLILGMFEKERFLDILRHFIFFEKDGTRVYKILAAYHQYYAVKKAVLSVIQASPADGNKKGGVFWHTQGSGKSYSMVYFSKLIMKPLNNPTIVILTDRNDLDDQLFNTFSKMSDYLRQKPVQAESRSHLKELLKDRQVGGLIFTTIQKFEEGTDCLSDRHNIVFIADEAHRSQYGLKPKVDKDGKISYGMAKYVRDALPNATFIGFTGTPINSEDKSTIEIFGNYIDIYDMTQAVEDNATVPIYYENRVIRLQLDKDVLAKIDSLYEDLQADADEYNIERSKKELAKLESILNSDVTVNAFCSDVIQHYESRMNLVEGKAMIVAYSRSMAIHIYNEILSQRPDWKGKVEVVTSSSNNDPEEWKKIIGTKEHKDALAKKFKDVRSEMKIAVVVDMWLTGFDIPSLDTMYFIKPVQRHNLMQAIARVNRVYPGKEGGLIVDYIGLAGALKKAMNDYTRRDREAYGDNSIEEKAYPKFLEKMEVLRGMFHKYDYGLFFTGTNLERAKTITGGIDFILYMKNEKKEFIQVAAALRKAEQLCISILSDEQKLEAAFFEAVRAGIVKIEAPDRLTLGEINKRINDMLKESIKTEGVINIFDDIGESGKLTVFDEDYLKAIADMEYKNLAMELLKKLLQDQVRAHLRINVVQSELFSEKMRRVLNSFNNNLITNAEVIEQLLELAGEIKRAEEAGDSLGLTVEEKAFYDAIIRPEGIRDFYSNDTLIEMSKKLTDLLRKNRSIDWTKKESARAKMRTLVKRLLREYEYPPDSSQEALDTVIRQAENWTDFTADPASLSESLIYL